MKIDRIDIRLSQIRRKIQGEVRKRINDLLATELWTKLGTFHPLRRQLLDALQTDPVIYLANNMTDELCKEMDEKIITDIMKLIHEN